MWAGVMQGPVPPALGQQLALESADLSNNYLTGPLDAFTSELGDDSRLYRLSLAGNRLTGPVSGLGKLGVFRVVQMDSSPTGMASPTSSHVLNISSNNFQGQLPFEFYGAPSLGGPAGLPDLRVRHQFTSVTLRLCCSATPISGELHAFNTTFPHTQMRIDLHLLCGRFVTCRQVLHPRAGDKQAHIDVHVCVRVCRLT
jgi:hypothetical protein